MASPAKKRRVKGKITTKTGAGAQIRYGVAADIPAQTTTVQFSIEYDEDQSEMDESSDNSDNSDGVFDTDRGPPDDHQDDAHTQEASPYTGPNKRAAAGNVRITTPEDLAIQARIREEEQAHDVEDVDKDKDRDADEGGDLDGGEDADEGGSQEEA